MAFKCAKIGGLFREFFYNRSFPLTIGMMINVNDQTHSIELKQLVIVRDFVQNLYSFVCVEKCVLINELRSE